MKPTDVRWAIMVTLIALAAYVCWLLSGMDGLMGQ